MIGGKRYIQLFCAIAGYFAISSHRIDPAQSNKYVAVYFLGFLTMIFGSIAPWMPRGTYWIYAMFPVESMAFASGPDAEIGQVRLGGVSLAATGFLYFLLAKYGLTGLLRMGERWRFLPLHFRAGFGINQPWRVLGMIAVFGISLMGGFRSIPITIILICGYLFVQERLYRTHWGPGLVLTVILGFAMLLPFIQSMPYTVQRSFSFLPIAVSDEVKSNAETSTNWRLEMWQEVLPTVPQYLLVGKGYGIDAREQEMALGLEGMGAGISQYDTAVRSADFHNGPLSLLIPLGLFGLVAFVWCLAASLAVLIRNYRHGDAAQKRFNSFLLALFVIKTFFFFVIYGSFQNDLAVFTGIVGLSCALNGGVRRPATAPAKPNPAYLPFRLPKPLRAGNA
jgi:O-antigen ligase